MENVNLNLKPPAQTRFLFLSFFLSFCNMVVAQQSTFYLETWQASQGEQPAVSLDRVLSTPSRTGGVYTVGSLYNESEGLYDLLVAHYNFRGDVLYQDTFNLPTPGNIIAGAITTNSSLTELFITGTVYNGSGNSYDVLTMKYDAAGQVDWYSTYNGIGNGYDGGSSLLVDSDTIYVGGAITDTTGLFGALCIKYHDGGTEVWDHVTTVNNRDLAIGTLSIGNPGELTTGVGLEFNNGTHRVGSAVLATSDGSTLSGFSENSQVDLDEITGFTADADQNLYVTGYSDAAGNGDDIVTVMLDDTLGLVWESVYNGSANSDDRPSSLDIDSLGNVYVGGYATGSNGRDFTVIKYNNSGTQQWAALYDGASHGDDEAKAVVAGKDGLVYATGSVDTLGQKDYHTRILKVSDGTTEWSASFNGLHSKDDEATSVALDGEGGLSVLGKNGLSNGSTEYMLVRYAKKQLTIPPGDGAASPALAFTEQRGQLTDTSGTSVEGVRFYSTGSFPPLYVKNDTLSFVAASVDTSSATPDTLHRVDITFFDSKTSLMSAAGLDKLDNYRNYYLGHIPEGRSRVGQYGRVAVTDLYDGINLQMFADESGIVYYFVIQPGGDPNDLKLDFHGQDSLYLKARNLFVGTSLGDFNLPAPKAFQIDSLGQEVYTAWKPEYSIAGSRVSFSSTGSYDSTKVLVVELRRDPVTVNSGDNWITYFGSNSSRDLVRAIDVDGGDNIFVAGETENFVFPDVDGELIDVSNNSDLSFNSAAVAKFNSQNVLNYITVLGGKEVELGYDIKVNGDNVFLVGRTSSSDIPLTSGTPPVSAGDLQGFLCKMKKNDGAIEILKVVGGVKINDFRAIDIHGDKIIIIGTSLGPGTIVNVLQTGAYNQSISGGLDVIIGETDMNLSFNWLTHYGGNFDENPVDVEFSDNNGHFFLVGATTSTFYSMQQNTPPTDSGFPNYSISSSDLFIKNNGAGGTNEDIFIAEFDASNNLLWSTFYGGSGIERFSPGANKIAVASNNKLAIVCSTSDFSTFPPPDTYGSFFQTGKGEHVVSVFVDRKLDWSSVYGCFENNSILPYNESGESVIYSSDGTLIAFGSTDCEPVPFLEYCGLPSSVLDYPICPPYGLDLYFQGTVGSPLLQGGKDVSIMGFTPSYLFKYGTYFGGNADEYVSCVANLSNGEFVFAGITESDTDFPLEFPASPDDVYEQETLYGSRDNFLAKLPIDGLTVTSVKENERSLGSGLTVFPNPVLGQQSVTLTFAPLSFDSEINLLNSLGQLIQTFALKRGNSELQVEFDNLPKGAYFFTMHGSAVKVIKN